MLKPIVTDTYDFPTLIRDGNVYVDKTALLARMVSADAFTSLAVGLRTELETAANAEQTLNRLLKTIFGMVPHDWQIQNEAEAKRYFLLFMKMAGADITVEVQSVRGRADAVLETRNAVYIFEFKYGKSAGAALSQCYRRGYADSYAADKRKVVVGVNFNVKQHVPDPIVLNEGVNEGVKTLYATIVANPGLNARHLAEKLHKSDATIERYIRVLKSDPAKIAFRGAPKNGGYYPRGTYAHAKI